MGKGAFQRCCSLVNGCFSGMNKHARHILSPSLTHLGLVL